MIPGADVHEGYGVVDWQRFKDGGGRFAWLKCTEGNENFVDAQYARSAAECERLEIPFGSYHFAEPLRDDPKHPGRSPEDQAERAFAACKGQGSKPGDLAHMVDMEWPPPQDAMAKWNVDRAFISQWLKRYCEHWTKLAGRPCAIYIYPDYDRWLEAAADFSWASEYLVVWADYGWPGAGTPPDDWTPPHWSWQKTWTDWAACQYSAEGSTARVPGINACPVDRDCIRSETMLLRLRGLDLTSERPTLPDLETPPNSTPEPPSAETRVVDRIVHPKVTFGAGE